MTARDAVHQTQHPAAALQPVRDDSGEIVELVYTSLNVAALRLYGMSSEDVVGSGLLELFPSARRTGILDAARRAIHTQDRVDIVAPWVDPDGVEQTFTQRAVPHGTGVVLTSHDVTATMLAESNQRFRQIAGADSDVVYTYDVDGVVEWVTPSVTEVLGWARDDFIGVSRRQLIHPDDLAIFAPTRPTTGQNPPDAHRVQMRFATVDGTWRWMAVFAHVIRDDHGVVIGAVEALRDVQSEVEALQALQRSVHDLRAAQRMAGLASWKWNPTTDEVVWANELFEMFGIAPDVRPPKFAEQTTLYGAESLQQLRAAIADATATGTSYDLELEFFRADASRGWMRSWGEAVLDDRGAVVEVRGYAQDITDQVEERRALERSDHALRATQRMARLGSWEWDIALGQLVWSDEMYELFELDPTQPPPAFAEQERLYGAQSWKMATAVVAEASRTGAPYDLELEIIRTNSEPGWVHVRGESVRDETGALVGLRGFMLDITDRVEALRGRERTALELTEAQRLARMGRWTLDTTTNELTWSAELYEMFGLDPTQPAPTLTEYLQLLTAESADRLRNAMADTDHAGDSSELELEFVRPDSRHGWIRSRAEQVLDDRGAIVEVRGYAQEITDQVEARRALEHSDHALRATQRMARLGSWEWDVAADHVTWSDELFELFGLDPAQQPPAYAEQANLYGPDSWEIASSAVEETARTGDPYDLELDIVRTNATRGWIHVRGEAVRNERGVIVGLRGFVLDITDQVEARRALASSEALFRTAMLASPIGMAMSELDGSFRVVNQSLCELLGRDEAWLTAHTIQDVTHPDDVELLMRDWHAVIDGEPVTEFEPLRLVNADNRILRVKRAAELIVDASGRPDYLLVQYVDTTAEHAALEDLAHQASHDPLTGLHNRTGIMDLLEADLRAPTEAGGRVGVLFIDLDNFKIVNDSLGHAAGDDVLIAVSDRITSVLRATDRFGRSGGDEFIVVVPDVTDAARAERVAEQIVSAVGIELLIRGHRIVPTVSIGVALSVSGSTSASLLRDADAALFRAKAAGRSRWQVFDDAMHTQALGRLTIEDEVRRGLGATEFVVHYQPIVTLVDRRVVGHEALVRWEHSTRGLLAPVDFLETAEDSGLVVDIGQHVLDHVCALLASRPDLPGPISVNFSPVQLAHADWLQNFTETLARHGVDPRRLVVEVTETAVMTLLPGTSDDLLALRDLGVGLHVDDFGTGFSSISLLRDMPVTGLKLDKSFVADLSDDVDAASALSTGLAGLVSGLHLTGIAEGVESEVQHRVLLGQGWSHGQGYLYGRPSPRPILTIAHDAEQQNA